MSVAFYGDYDTTETVVIPFNTFSSDDPSASVTITDLAAADIEIHKDGGLTQRSSDAGVTVSINFDSVTGNHIVSIDLSDNTDAGFYANGSRYQVRMEGTTIDAATINAWIGSFSIGCSLRPTTAGNTLDVTSTGAAGIDWGNIENKTTANDLSATDIQLCDTVTTNTDMRGTDSAALASVCTEGRLAELDAANIPADVDNILIDTAEIGAAGEGLTNINLPNQTMDITGNITGNLSGSVGSVTGAVGSVTGSVGSVVGHTAQTGDSFARLGAPIGASISADITDVPTVAEFEARTPTAAQLLYITRHASSAVPVTFTTSGGTTTNAVLNLVDGAAASSTADVYNGRVLIFLDGTLKDQATDITDYDASKNATITAITTAPTASHNAIMV